MEKRKIEAYGLLSRDLSVEVRRHLRAVQETFRQVDPPVRACNKMENETFRTQEDSETFTANALPNGSLELWNTSSWFRSTHRTTWRARR